MYHLRALFATTSRIQKQLAHDPRTVLMIFVVPLVLLGLLRWLFDENQAAFDRMAPALLGIFPFVLMFIVTSITTLRERTGGTMERLMAMLIGKLDFVMGYMLAFGILAIIQALLASALILYGFEITIEGPEWFLILTALASALLGTALGIFVSAYAQTEFQAVQFMPALVMPQVLVCGLFLPLSAMPDLLEKIAWFLPLTYAVDALNLVVTNTDVANEAWRDLWVVAGFTVGAVLLGALTLRRRTA